MEESFQELWSRIIILNERVWENRINKQKIEAWLNNFDGKVTDSDVEKLHALYWLSQFMYFGGREIRVLLRSLYRDLFLCPLIQKIKVQHGEIDSDALERLVEAELKNTRFVGVGNPSESGVHLLYYFRQENNLSKMQFIDAVQIFSRSSSIKISILKKIKDVFSFNFHPSRFNLSLRYPEVKRYVFLDDICGSGETATTYSKEILGQLKKLNPNIEVAYYSLFATEKAIENVKNTLYGDNVGAVYELDKTYRCLDSESRYLQNVPSYIDPDIARRIAIEYGQILHPGYASGYKDSQMLMGFHHNTPDNTLGIMWCDQDCGADVPWQAIFKRYPKIYGAES